MYKEIFKAKYHRNGHGIHYTGLASLNSRTIKNVPTNENLISTRQRRTEFTSLIEMPLKLGITERSNRMISRLKADGLYNSGLLFSGFNGIYGKNVIETGKKNPDKETVFCSTEDELFQVYFSAFNYVGPDPEKYYDSPAIAVYNGKMMVEKLVNEYLFKPGINPKDAVVAVYLSNLVN